MNKEIDILKVSSYDKFKCTADKCRFTCCEGWDIGIDNDTYNKWKKENHRLNNILNNVKTKKCGKKIEYLINKETNEVCPLLDEQGLCEVVKKYGEGYLSLICHRFPRIENTFEDTKELLLSCACPEAVEIIGSINGKINMVSEDGANLKNTLLELKIRETLINIIQQEGFSLEDKLITSFEMLLSILENKEFSEDSLLEELEKYNNREYTREFIDMHKEIKLNIKESIEEINSLFLDVVQNYKEVSNLSILLKDIYDYGESVKIKSLSAKWKDYKKLFEQHNMLVENCIVSKILSGCVSDDVKEMVISFQMIILEYLLVRYAVFLKYCVNNNSKIYAQDIKDYVVAFSRIIGNNSDAVVEFLRDGFGEEILETGYLCFISLF